jgi:iron(III) transport system substrate-binding protein
MAQEISQSSSWEKTVASAKGEAQIGIVAEETYLPVFQEFNKRYPEIKISLVGGGSGALRTQKLMAERRAGQYLRDVYIGGTPMAAFGLDSYYKVFDPIKPALQLPEVVDETKWWRQRHYYEDPTGYYTFMYEGNLRSGNIVYSTKLVNPDEIKSYWDLLHPKWKGKIVISDPGPGPSASGSVGIGLRVLYYHPAVGPEFIRRLFSEMDVTPSRDEVQILNWVATAKFAFGLFLVPTNIANAIVKHKLPIGRFTAASFKEGGMVSPTVGTISLIKQTPHPNAAKVFINWLLSKEGQSVFQKSFASATDGEQGNSLREDIPKDIFPEEYRRVAGVNYLFAGPETYDTAIIMKLVNEARAAAGK